MGFLTPLHSGGTILTQKHLTDSAPSNVKHVCDTLPGKQPAEEYSPCLKSLSVLMVVDVHLCLITPK